MTDAAELTEAATKKIKGLMALEGETTTVDIAYVLAPIFNRILNRMPPPSAYRDPGTDSIDVAKINLEAARAVSHAVDVRNIDPVSREQVADILQPFFQKLRMHLIPKPYNLTHQREGISAAAEEIGAVLSLRNYTVMREDLEAIDEVLLGCKLEEHDQHAAQLVFERELINETRRAWESMNTGASRIQAERARQRTEEDWTDDHDDKHVGSELAWAAACYAAPEDVYRALVSQGTFTFKSAFPWEPQWDKRKPNSLAGTTWQEKQASKMRARQRALEKAGALCAAEWDRLQRRLERGQVVDGGGVRSDRNVPEERSL